ncbi:hypothetical protein AQJ43_02975 [Streptomyces avermitilis]|uniref:Uncharacterized protein n=2 Tax=Streptomyces avermitilis TaxID=33903 RepID=Q82HW7_STRAW|nr:MULTISPECIES: hypothetical protein [Streptomyces]KUN56576.1 hypothetical protein AQJ43_02975 [Streptomyces avermitilis]MYS98991.1 hypothetical protein [Streptomyces sp. SID5469]OOV32695.1 hypothetical protein SM007_07795 [Streptomyces avermitilis]BAC71102.1 hypothetical protein SAVERM_3390 [Streptomyces avermitilis MA-4680 = NBRC 14893]BBJ51275.1 hypothetical protein SAVMC3_39040 [Streptomyces avermitilis]
MSLVELIAEADERGLAASGLACLDRCVPLLGGDDEVLRPLWASLVEGREWEERLTKARAELGAADAEPTEAEDEACGLARRMLDAVPAQPAAGALREWADACSVAALQIHRLLDAADDGPGPVSARREGRTEGMSPLVAAELRRQVTVLELVAGHGAGGLRRALDVSTEGRRVLRAVVSRRARGRA